MPVTPTSSLLATGIENERLVGLFRVDQGSNRVHAGRSQQNIPARRRRHAGRATDRGRGDPAVLLQDEIFGREIVLVGDDSGLQDELLRRPEGSEAEIRSVARRRVRKSRGEQEESSRRKQQAESEDWCFPH